MDVASEVGNYSDNPKVSSSGFAGLFTEECKVVYYSTCCVEIDYLCQC